MSWAPHGISPLNLQQWQSTIRRSQPHPQSFLVISPKQPLKGTAMIIFERVFVHTRMRSCRMQNIDFSGHFWGCLPRGVCVPGGVCLGVCVCVCMCVCVSICVCVCVCVYLRGVCLRGQLPVECPGWCPLHGYLFGKGGVHDPHAVDRMTDAC